MDKRLAIVAIILIAVATLALIRRGTTPPPTTAPDLPLEFVQVNPTFPFPNLSMTDKLKFDIAWAAASAPAIMQGKKITWSGPAGCNLSAAIIQYCGFSGKTAYLETSIRTNNVGPIDFAAITPAGITKAFEKAMKTNQTAFVRDHTNGIWIMSAANGSTGSATA